jgi:hypothetical protein
MIYILTLPSRDQAIALRGQLIATFDPMYEGRDLCNLAENLSNALDLPVISMEIPYPDNTWTWPALIKSLNIDDAPQLIVKTDPKVPLIVFFEDEHGNELARLTAESSDADHAQSLAVINKCMQTINLCSSNTKTLFDALDLAKKALSSRNMILSGNAHEYGTDQAAIDALDLVSNYYSVNGSRSISAFKFLNGGINPNGYTVNATRCGDAGIYEELSIGIYLNDEPVADIVVGLTELGEPRIACSVDSNPDHHQVEVFPLRKDGFAISKFNQSMNPVQMPNFVTGLQLPTVLVNTPMANTVSDQTKQITVPHLAEIVQRLLLNTAEGSGLEDAESYKEFISDVAMVVGKWCGGDITNVSINAEGMLHIAVHENDPVAPGSGIWN